ncbi:hypothetical protein [Egicoccus sp. AB-alg2]|uniref:hypothetical protein n=1 Tax=Egicoccus sp. AB-alg2 TaxID=3242693 RepID=UPI00359DB526
MLEDFVPLDVRSGVRSRWRDGLYRLVPGGFEAPVSIVESARFHSWVLDSRLYELLGFGIGDLVELVLRACDSAVARLEPGWPPDPVDREAEVRVSRDECEAVAEVPSLEDLVEDCADPEAARAALAWATVPLEDAAKTLANQHHTLGPVLAVGTDGATYPVPPGMLLDVVFEAVPILRRLALEEDEVAERWQQAARLQVLSHLVALGPYAKDCEIDGEDPVDFLIRVSADLVLAVCVVATPDNRELSRAKSRLRRVVPGASVRVGEDGRIDIDPSAEVARLAVVIDGENMFIGTLAGEVHVQTATVQELRWMVSTSDRPSDVPRFLIDRTEDDTRGMAFGTIDQWEVWRTGTPGPFQMGVSPTFVSWAPHSEKAEWEHHRDTAWVTEALFEVGQGSVAEWTSCTLDDNGSVVVAELVDAARHRAIRVAVVGGVVVAVAWGLLDGARLSGSDIARSIMWRLVHAEPAVAELAEPRGVLRLQVAPGVDGPETAVEARRSTDGVVTIIHSTAEDQEGLAAFEGQVGRALASLSSADADTVLEAWENAPLGLVVETRSVPYVVTEPPFFSPPHPAIVAAERRELARALYSDGQPTGSYTGSDAVELERRIDEHLRQRLMVLLDGVRSGSVIRTATKALEQLHARREFDAASDVNQRRLRDAAGQPTDFDELSRSRQESTIWVRSLAHLVELALTRPTEAEGGASFAGRIEDQAVAVASLVLESGQRRAAAHFRLTDIETLISDSYEVTLTQSPGQIDIGAFVRTRAAAEADERDAPDSVAYFRPEDVEAISRIVETHLGFSTAVMRTLLATMTRWPVSTHELVAATTLDELVQRASSEAPQSESELQAAAEWLTLRADNLADPLDHWNVDQRDHRLATRPLIDLGSGHLLIAPRGAGQSEAVIFGHLTDFRSPWGSSGPEKMRSELARLREARNVRFEREMEEALADATALTVRRNLKQGYSLGAWTLEREVDLIVVDGRRRRLWIVDVKDPTMPFAPNQIGRSLTRYYAKDGHVSKVLGSVARARPHAASVAAELLGENHGNEWDVRGAIISRRIEAAAFVEEPGLHFMTYRTAAESLDADVLPDADYGAVRARTGHG